MKNNIFKYLFIVFFIIFLIIIYAVFYNKENDKGTKDQTSTKTNIITDLRIGIAGYDTLNPIVSNNKNVKDVSKLIFDSLININENYKLEYKLASQINRLDNVTYEIKLRENVYWHDGTLFTANDVKFTFDKIKQGEGFNSKYRSNLDKVSSIEIIDDLTLKVSLSSEVEFFEYKLTFPILSEKFFVNEDFVNTIKNDQIIGTGKFYIGGANDNKFTLLKNDKYWNIEKENAMLKEIEITVYNTIGEVYNDFKSGRIDLVDVSVSNIEEYVGNLGYNKSEYYTRNVDFLSINENRNEHLKNVNVRKALNYLIDKNNLVSNLGPGFTVSQFAFPKNHWLYDNKLDVDFNIEEGKRLLAEAGYINANNTWVKDGKILEFTLTVNSEKEDRVKAANNLVAQFLNYGINVYLNLVPENVYKELLYNKNYDVILCGFETEFSPKVSTLLRTENIANYSNPEMDKLINEGVNEVQNENLEGIYDKIYDIFLNDMPYIFLYRETDYLIYNQTVCGTLNPNSLSVFHNIEKWYRK